MTNRKSRKQTITEIVRQSLPKNHPAHELVIDDLVYKWWFTARTGSGLRLTDEGMNIFLEAEITHYDFVLESKDRPNDFKPEKFVLELSKKIDCPFYLGVRRNSTNQLNETYIRIYDNKIAMMLSLYGSLHEYLNSIKVKT